MFKQCLSLKFGIMISLVVLMLISTSCMNPTITSDVFYSPEDNDAGSDIGEIALKDPREINKEEEVKVVYFNGCYDTDMARNYYSKGTCYDEKVYKKGASDYCIDSHNLVEFYCSNDLSLGCRRENYFCNHSCFEGACLE